MTERAYIAAIAQLDLLLARTGSREGLAPACARATYVAKSGQYIGIPSRQGAPGVVNQVSCIKLLGRCQSEFALLHNVGMIDVAGRNRRPTNSSNHGHKLACIYHNLWVKSVYEANLYVCT